MNKFEKPEITVVNFSSFEAIADGETGGIGGGITRPTVS